MWCCAPEKVCMSTTTKNWNLLHLVFPAPEHFYMEGGVNPGSPKMLDFHSAEPHTFKCGPTHATHFTARLCSIFLC